MSPGRSVRRARRVLGAVAAVLAVGLAGCTAAPPAPPPAVPSQDRPKLTWAPPPLSDPETIMLDEGQTVTRMDPNRDYVIELPRMGKGDTFLAGGRNIVLIGGHISTGDGEPPWDVPEHRAIYITGATGTVHIEGVLIDDIDEGRGDGIAIAAPEATVQIQNVRVIGLTGEQRENHADVVQIWGGVEELRIDRLTGATDYQGLHIQPDLAPNGKETIKNTNLYSTSPRSGNWLIWLAKGSYTCETPAQVVLEEVYVSPRAGRSLGESVWPPYQGAELDDSRSAAVRSCLSELSADGSELRFPRLPQVSGVVKKGPPPGGDFVPDGVAGPDYVSPGYEE